MPYGITSEEPYRGYKEYSSLHRDVKLWHYFVNDIYYVEQGDNEMQPVNMNIDIKEKADGSFVYTYHATKEETNRPLSVATRTDDTSPKNNVPQSGSPGKADCSIEEADSNTRYSIVKELY